MKENMEQMGFLKGVLIVFFVGFLIGIFLVVGLREYLGEYLDVFYSNFISNLGKYELEYGVLWKKVVKKRVESFFLMGVFGISILGIPYVVCFLIWKGIFLGFLFGSMIVQFGGKGVVIGILYGFPQMIFYVPVMYAMMHKDYCMGVNGLKKKVLWEELPSVVVLLVILLVGCVLEVYVNTWVLKKVFTF